MQKNEVIKKIEELLDNPENLTSEKMEAFVREMIQFFSELRLQLGSSDQKIREDALKLAGDIKVVLEEKAMRICESIGMDPKTLETYINNSTNFSAQEKQAMDRAKKEINEYRDAFKKLETSEQPNIKKRPKVVNQWIAG